MTIWTASVDAVVVGVVDKILFPVRMGGVATGVAKFAWGLRRGWPAAARVASAAALLAGVAACGGREDAAAVDFNRDIRPLLTRNCTACHGGVRKLGGLSFVFREEAIARGASGRLAIVPGDAGASELMARLESDDPEFRMPHHAPPLQAQDIALFRRWIEQGASWQEHWAFVPPKPQALPVVRQPGWIRQPLDRFVLARLEHEGLKPAPEADKPALLRRVSFDLTGLPPTPDELQAFVDDDSPQAYEKQVDRLLGSRHYGERWASMWMDLARYADSRGFEKDRHRPGVWVFRDWVVNAFNRNLPYDQFVIRQLAGDLLPGAGIEDRIATTFNRLTPANDEGGTDDEEYRTIAVMDRAATAWGTLNGFTMNCVQCHAHPYDPVRHEDYYRFLAYFNTTLDADLADDSPYLPVPTDPGDYDQADARWRQLQAARSQLVATSLGLVADPRRRWTPAPVVSARANVAEALAQEIGVLKAHADRAELAELEALRAQALAHPEAATPKFRIRAGEAFTEGLGRNITVYDYVLAPPPARLTALRLVFAPVDPAQARATPEDGFIINHIRLSKLRADGGEEPITVAAFLPDSQASLDYRLTDLTRDGARPNFSNTAARVYRQPIEGAEGGARLLAVDGIAAGTKLPAARWTVAIPAQAVTLAPGERLKLRIEQLTRIEHNFTLRRVAASASDDPRWLQAPAALMDPAARVVAAYNAQTRIDSVPLPVMAEQPPSQRRDTRRFDRGNALTKVGPALAPGMPAVFPQPAKDRPADRLAMARAFFDPEQPLTARVAVNRYWEQLFGLGIVETLEDFGSAGLPPTHPELLDWLARHYQRDLKWDTKALLRELVLSASYRQGARATPALLQRDPRNRLLARGPRQRLTAEMVRDQALVASGLLTPTLGGPPVMPPQPEGVWKVVYSSDQWRDATGPDRYRRALYTFIKRSAMYPSLLTFDAPAHEVSVARRMPTNTPLQALITQNDPVYTEAWRALAKRVLQTPAARLPRTGNAADEVARRLNLAGCLVLSRDLTAEELDDVQGYYRTRLAGTSPERAMTAVAGLLFNLDAALNR